MCDVADAAMGCAFASTLEADETFTTLDLTTKFFKPVWDARLRVLAQVTKRTRTLGLVECEITDESGSLVAKVFSTCTAPRGEEAKERAIGDDARCGDCRSAQQPDVCCLWRRCAASGGSPPKPRWCAAAAFCRNVRCRSSISASEDRYYRRRHPSSSADRS